MALAYVLRYGGVLDESAHECDAALFLDPGSYPYPVVFFTFDEMGNYGKGLEFLQLDAGSDWVSRNIVSHSVRAGNLAQAREQSEKSGDTGVARMMRACLHNAPTAEVDKLARELAPEILADPDAENRYRSAPTSPSVDRRMSLCACSRAVWWASIAPTPQCRTTLCSRPCEARPSSTRSSPLPNSASPTSSSGMSSFTVNASGRSQRSSRFFLTWPLLCRILFLSNSSLTIWYA